MSLTERWHNTSSAPLPGENEIHVWKILLSEFPAGEGYLTEDEITRAQRLHVDQPKIRFVAARSALRIILGSYLGVPPRELEFIKGPHGKPALAGKELSFNLSHAGGLALLAVTRSCPVGIDIEHMSSARASDEIAARFFSLHEQESLVAYPDGERAKAFFRIWSRKEAVIKALGEGLACPLHSFDVSADEKEAALLAFRRAGIDCSRWMMTNLHVEENYAAAFAIMKSHRDQAMRFRLFNFAPA